jgi:hypothetical protein
MKGAVEKKGIIFAKKNLLHIHYFHDQSLPRQKLESVRVGRAWANLTYPLPRSSHTTGRKWRSLSSPHMETLKVDKRDVDVCRTKRRREGGTQRQARL